VNRPARVDALVFDFDGLILDTEGSVFDSWRRAWEERGVELTVEEWAHCIGGVGLFDPIAELEQRSGRPFTDDDAARRRAYRDEILARETVLPGIVDHLAAAAERGLPVAIASSSPRAWIAPHLARLELAGHFSSIVCYDADGPLSPKPAPDLYRHATELLGTHPDRTIAYEDSVNGVTAARAAGLRCVAVPGPLTRHLDFSAADLVIDSLASMSLEEVLAALELV